MPLTNVWTRDANGEWMRTTATATDRNYSHSVSADEGHFRCYSCFQYVTFVKGSAYRVSHFKHSSGYHDKDCEDRSFNSSVSYSYISLANMAMPMRITIDGSMLTAYIGLQPIGGDELNNCVSHNLQISISGSYGASVVYRLDASRVAPHTTTWLPVPTTALAQIKTEFMPKNVKPSVWSGVVPEISSSGAVFDVQTGRRIPDLGDVVVNRDYYVLLRRGKHLYNYSSDISVVGLTISDTTWNVYKVRAYRFSKQSSDFFFEQLRLRLTNYPVEMGVLWPPMLEKDDILETNFRNFKLLVKGEADFSTFPRYYSSSTCTVLRDNIMLYDVRSNGILQMVTSERYNRTLAFMYIRPIEREFSYSDPYAEVFFDDGQSCTDTFWEDTPPGGILHFTLSDDGYVDVYEEDVLLYRKYISADEKTRLTDLKNSMRVSVYIGLEWISSIEIASKQPRFLKQSKHDMRLWIGKPMPFPKRYAWILERLDPDSELYERTLCALQQGKIPKDGLQTLQMVTEELDYVF